MDYQDFLETKKIVFKAVGKRQVSQKDVNPLLFEFQRDLVTWAVRKGRCAIFSDTGTGKTLMQLAWAHLMGEKTLIIAPLSVANQTVREAKKLDIDIRYVRHDSNLGRLSITNYEMFDRFDPGQFGAIVLDESSIIKGLAGKIRQRLNQMFADTPYKLCCTATPAPNDIAEIANHAEFLSIMNRIDMLATFFVHDSEGWRLRGHAKEGFYKWLASWGMSVKKPSDLGYDDNGFVLPQLNVKPTWVDTDYVTEGKLFFMGLGGIQGRTKVRKATIEVRLAALKKLVHSGNSEYNLCNEFSECEDENGLRQGLSDTVLSGTSKREVRTSEEKKPGNDTRAKGEAQGIYETISSSQFGKVETNFGTTGKSEYSPQGTLCTGRRKADCGSEESKGMGEGTSEKEESTKVETISDNSGRVQHFSDETGREVRNLRLFGHEQSKFLSDGRSLSQNRDSQGSFVHELQYGNRKNAGQFEPVEESIRISGKPEQWIIWCGLNDEQDAVTKLLGNECVSIYGSMSIDEKEHLLEKWLNGNATFLVSKLSIYGFGLNLQQAHKMVFFGLNDSFEGYYQGIRRVWRFGQTHPVDVYVVLADVEQEIYENVMSKEREAITMSDELIRNVQQYEREEIQAAGRSDYVYETETKHGKNWTMMLGDSVERLKELGDNSIDLLVYSPPFQALYTYTATERDLGNSRDVREFMEHYQYIIEELLRVMKPGRVTAVHTMDVPAMLVRDGWMGLKDFSGDVIRAYTEAGWVYDGRIPIDKNPQSQAIRTHAKQLTMSQKDRDRSWIRPALPDYILKFRKPGENQVPIQGGMDGDTWIEYANPTWPADLWTEHNNVRYMLDYLSANGRSAEISEELDRAYSAGAFNTWFDIRETDVLNNWQRARADKDDRHICPLALPTIRRCIELWSNPNELILDPFMGIGSVGVEALKLGRRVTGIELKESYYSMAVLNLEKEEAYQDTGNLFSTSAEDLFGE